MDGNKCILCNKQCVHTSHSCRRVQINERRKIMAKRNDNNDIRIKVSDEVYGIFKEKVNDSGLTQKEFLTTLIMDECTIPILKYGKETAQALIDISCFINSIDETDERKERLKGACETIWQSLK